MFLNRIPRSGVRRHGVYRHIRLLITIGAIIVSAIIYLCTGAYYALVSSLCITAFMVASCLISRFTGKGLEVRIRGSEDIERGREVSFGVEIRNRSRIPVFRIRVAVEICNCFTGECYVEEAFGSAKPKETIRISIPVTGDHSGLIRTRMKMLEIRDPLDIFSSVRACVSEGRIYIMPDYKKMQIGEDTLSAFDMESYKYSPYKKGDDPGDIYGIRDYVPGDSVRNIHWKLSGKLGKLEIKELGYPEDNDIILLLDRRIKENTLNTGSVYERYDWMDRAADLTATLSNTLIQKGIPHTAAWYDKDLRTIRFFRIKDPDEMIVAVRAMLETGFYKSELSTAKYYIMERQKPKAQHLYITEDESDVDKLREDGEVTVFSPSNYQ